jgi:hypothetical protein
MIKNSDIFEIRFYKDEYSKQAIAVSEPDVFSFISTLDKISKKRIEPKTIETIFNKVCSDTNMSFKRKLSNGIVCCIAIKDDVPESQLLEYMNQSLNEEQPKKRAYHKRTSEEIEESKKAKAVKGKKKAGRPKGSKNKRQKISIKKGVKGKPGRPALSKEEKNRRLKKKAATRLRSNGKVGRPKKNKKSV